MDNIAIGLSTTVIGLLIVGSVLGALCLIVYLMQFLVAPGVKTGAGSNADSEKKNIDSPASASPALSLDSDEISEELVAVITAALAASLNTTVDSLIVRSIKRSQTWSQTVRQEL